MVCTYAESKGNLVKGAVIIEQIQDSKSKIYIDYLTAHRHVTFYRR